MWAAVFGTADLTLHKNDSNSSEVNMEKESAGPGSVHSISQTGSSYCCVLVNTVLLTAFLSRN